MVVGAAAVAGYVERRTVGRFGCGGLWLSVIGAMISETGWAELTARWSRCGSGKGRVVS